MTQQSLPMLAARGEPFDFGEKLRTLSATKSDERRPGITEALAVRVSKQGTERASLSIPICADDQEFAFGEAFRLQPGLRPTTAIGGHRVLGDDAFQAHIATRGE